MCKHHWHIDGNNQGICQTCRKSHDFIPDIKRVFKFSDRGLAAGVKMTQMKLISTNGYPIQGGFVKGYGFNIPGESRSPYRML